MTPFEKLKDAIEKKSTIERALIASDHRSEFVRRDLEIAREEIEKLEIVVDFVNCKVTLGGSLLVVFDDRKHRVVMTLGEFATLVSKLIAAGALKIETVSEVVLAGGAKP